MLSVNELLDVIRSPEVEYVSFDVFDTLVVRPFLKPADLFVLMEQEVQQVLGCRDLPDFSALRHAAEVQARRVHAGREDITLTQIYEQLCCLTGLEPERAALLREMETAYELRYCVRRETSKRLWDAALGAKKCVIVVSDMYLPTETIASILTHNGYEGYSGLYVSGDVGKTKASGHLFEHVQKTLSIAQGKHVLHIGDNIRSDIQRARAAGWKAYPLYNPKHLLLNQVRKRRMASPLLKCFQGFSGNTPPQGGEKFLGLRCMLAVVANHVFDDPYIGGKDPFVCPSNSGYFALGMYLLATAQWLHREAAGNGYDTLCFFARDGRLVKQAFERLVSVLPVQTQTRYVRLSRTALLPLMLERREDLWALPYILNGYADYTPRKLRKVLYAITLPSTEEEWLRGFASQGFMPDEPLESIEHFQRFMLYFFDNFFDPQMQKHNAASAKAYLMPLFTGRCATFDVGYKLRAETALRRLLAVPITSYTIHQDCDLAIRRGHSFSVPTHTLYPFTPFVSWRIRELLLEPDEPGCIGYGPDGNPILDKENNSLKSEPLKCFQQAGLLFVEDMITLFGKKLEFLPYREVDACIPFEALLCSGSRKEIQPFLQDSIEDEFSGMNPGTCSAWAYWRADYRAALARDGKWKRRVRISLAMLCANPHGLVQRTKRFLRKRLLLKEG